MSERILLKSVLQKQLKFQKNVDAEKRKKWEWLSQIVENWTPYAGVRPIHPSEWIPGPWCLVHEPGYVFNGIGRFDDRIKEAERNFAEFGLSADENDHNVRLVLHELGVPLPEAFSD
ncbi:hypothetical protein E8E12_002040 [Didymella heteroderae]|uniref:Uncharacterized protein n=1 Tax=Didymella heteroderae TaxID=1769908 RepID=A0A9P4WKU6_9PLEO|nr:hypothetical protein E8E12_002040 [Didymella heteroderae]